jgi:hypothetical protein
MKNPIIKSFMDGIAYFFGVGENPIEVHYREMVRKRNERNKIYEGLSGPEIDARNLAGDWERVGMYLKNAMGRYEHETADAKE